MTAFLICFVLLLGSNIWGWILLPFCLLVGWGRIYGGVHYPADILGGIAVALVSYFILENVSLDLFLSFLPHP